MASVKVKYRAYSVNEKSGLIYYQIIHKRVTRRITTDYCIKSDEWDAKSSMITVLPKSKRTPLIFDIREKIKCDVARINRIILQFFKKGNNFTTHDVVNEFNRYRKEYSLFNYMENAIEKLKQKKKTGTAENYNAALRSFKGFRNNEDIMLDCITSDLIEQYEAWLLSRQLCPNTISFYNRILRAVYHRAVEAGIIEDTCPFKHVYTGISKTIKRALSLENIRKIKALELTAHPNQEYARDIFLLSLYLRGMALASL